MTEGDSKQQAWQELEADIARLNRRRGRGLRRLSPEQLSQLIDRYQSLLADLARARSLEAPPATVNYLNQLAVSAHQLLYGQRPLRRLAGSLYLWGALARAVDDARGAVGLSACMFFGPALISCMAILIDPNLALDLVPPEFYSFDPTSADHFHEIPSLARPVVASSIIANNLQVTFLAFALGTTLGLGTTAVLIFNGMHIGSVIGWMTLRGQLDSLIGWLLPHAVSELLAITLAGGAGYLMAGAMLAPGLSSRLDALQRAARQALIIELGCMVMLLVAGLIEGYVSPSDLSFGPRVAIMLSSLTLWGSYFGLARPRKS